MTNLDSCVYIWDTFAQTTVLEIEMCYLKHNGHKNIQPFQWEMLRMHHIHWQKWTHIICASCICVREHRILETHGKKIKWQCNEKVWNEFEINKNDEKPVM